METLIIAALIVGGLIFFAIEVFLIPGVSLAGILAGISILYAIGYAFANLGVTGGIVTIAAAGVGIGAVTVWFMKSKTVDRLSLKQTIDYRPDPLKGTDLKVGDTGMTVTRLTLIGNAEFDGHTLEVKSVDGFIDERTEVTVTKISGGIVYVKRTQHINS